MERLPFALGTAICEVLELEDIANLRLVPKYICEVATPFLLSEV